VEISQQIRNQIENAYSLDSNSKVKKEFFKEVVFSISSFAAELSF